ncbi:hypothetical protein [Vibrio sp. 1CM23M]|uniref:hypothetical protein n=1 Tax=Vibrio sp. 1CM23M TaxID=2929164 RepID=UPI0020BFB286|nr:hypothetical protein [Vibrio sp. 1CM23M]MCK8071409.1 hypothetical protein [Vibrio sp. 1CM23M]
MKLYIPSATLSVLLLSPSFASAEDIPDSYELRNFSMRSQSSGIAPPQEELGVYVVNSGPGLDTGCTYASGGPLLISLPVPMVVSPNVLQSDGRIAPSKLGDMQQKGVIGSNARISMPVFDIDSNANVSNIAPEIDIVSFNGKSLGTLQGADNRWTDTNLQSISVISSSAKTMRFASILILAIRETTGVCLSIGSQSSLMLPFL